MHHVGSDQQSDRDNQCSCQGHPLTVHASALIALQPVILGSDFAQHATGAAHQYIKKDQQNVFEGLIGQVPGTDDAANVVLQLQLCLPATTLLSF